MSYLSQNLSAGGLKFGADQISQLASRSSKNSFDPLQYESSQRVLLPNDTLFQILQITDVTKSAAQELEYLNEFDDEQHVITDKVSKSNVQKKKKKTVITSIDMDSEHSSSSSSSVPSYNKTLYKMLLQDSSGNLSYATELEKLNFLKSSQDKILPIPLGSKIVVKKNTLILRGCLLLYNKDCTFIGGQIPELNNNYLNRRIRQLQQDIDDMRK